jgi:ATP-dependent RNA/DNA helicase IGHMBP2
MNEQVKKELEELKQLLLMEKEADFEHFKKMIEQLPLQERKEKGFTWYPLQVQKSGYTYGDRAYVIVERTKDLDQHHQFRSGKIVRLFTFFKDAGPGEKRGVVHFVDKNRMKIILNSKDLPDWLNKGELGVDLLFDERTYLEMEKALEKVKNAKRDRLAELRSILMGVQAPSFNETTPVEIPFLNPSQNEAVDQILAARDVAVIHGPPGTGKTTTLVYAIKVLAQREHTVLVTAPSNTAVDLLTERLAQVGLNVVRVGNISRVDESIIRHSLDFQIGEHPESKNIKKVKKEAAEMRRKAKRYRRKFGSTEHRERRQLFREAGELEAWAGQLERRIIDQILSGAHVITCTLVGANSKVLENRTFRTVVIDEAAQALQPAAWIPIIKSSKVILAGDPFQLPPTVKSFEAAKGGFGITLIERCIQQWEEVSLLNIQYRMHYAIMGFSNQQFYSGTLQAAEHVKRHQLDFGDHPPIVFIDTAGCGFEEKVNPEYQSRYNPDEFQILCEHLYQLIDRLDDYEFPSVAIISPYREQVEYMKDLAEEDSRLSSLPIKINTIDAFQGQERDVIYISLVRSNGKGEIGFLKDYRRMNVAMTRARKLLVVIGDSATIGAHDFYRAFMDYADLHGAYQTAWEYMQ